MAASAAFCVASSVVTDPQSAHNWQQGQVQCNVSDKYNEGHVTPAAFAAFKMVDSLAVALSIVNVPAVAGVYAFCAYAHKVRHKVRLINGNSHKLVVSTQQLFTQSENFILAACSALLAFQ